MIHGLVGSLRMFRFMGAFSSIRFIHSLGDGLLISIDKNLQPKACHLLDLKATRSSAKW